jgi:predicted nucleic acid-binding protein
MVVIDSDVFLLEFAFHRDPRHETNARFLTAVRDHTPATTVYNLMEILGQLSFNLAPDRLAQWQLWLQAAYGLSVLWPDPGQTEASAFFHQEIYEQPLARMQAHRMAFLDALVLDLVERAPDVEAFVTWNARHFQNKSSLAVLTPAEYLA